MGRRPAKIPLFIAGRPWDQKSVYGHMSENEHPCQMAPARQFEATPSDYTGQSK
jgi:hypothetical protein